MKELKKIFLFSFFLFLVFGNILAVTVFFDLQKSRFFKIILFNVGQGDAVFIETPQRHQILIDGGPDSKILEKLSKQMPFWDRTIDLIILTHPEKDHLSGLLDVLARYKVKNILWTGTKREIKEFKEWQERILKEGANIETAKAGQKIIVGKAIFQILYPFEDLKDKEIENTNETSIVVKLILNKNSFLFSGDIGKLTEKEIIKKYLCLTSAYCQVLKSDVLKISHHGSKNSTSKEFLERVLPETALISVGKNNLYGHPHKEVLEILKNYGIKILRTDTEGDIKIFSDGEKLKIVN